MPSPSSNKPQAIHLKTALTKHRDQAKSAIHQKHQKAAIWLEQNQLNFKDLRKKTHKLVAGLSLATSVLLAPPPDSAITTPAEITQKLKQRGFIAANELEHDTAQTLAAYLPKTPGHATTLSENDVSQVIFDHLGIKATPQLEGHRLNHSIGYMGYEQHLKRFPGDTIFQHDEQQQAGIAPGLGAWGYFIHSKEDFTNEAYLKEKYYFAVQTMYIPNWNTDTRRLYDWYKHRKMIAINPTNGRAVVGVVGDAGPAKFTGKHFGGSPEVMAHLNVIRGNKKGLVLLYFVDDPNNQIPLGPVRSNYQIARLIES